MFPTINKKETGVNLRRIMDMRGVKPKDIQEYLGFGCVQSVYRWLDGVSMPTVDNLYAISKMLQVPMDLIDEHEPLKTLQEWWNSISGAFSITGVGKIIAYINAKRCIPELPDILE